MPFGIRGIRTKMTGDMLARIVSHLRIAHIQLFSVYALFIRHHWDLFLHFNALAIICWGTQERQRQRRMRAPSASGAFFVYSKYVQYPH